MVEAAGGTVAVQAGYALPALVRRNPFSDDFGLFMAAAPGCLLLVGTANPAKGITETWHRPGFDIDEDALPLAVEALSLTTLDVLH